MELVPGGETRRNNWINMGRNRGNTVLGAKRQQAIETIRYIKSRCSTFRKLLTARTYTYTFTWNIVVDERYRFISRNVVVFLSHDYFSDLAFLTLMLL